jgi:L-amino acid N-acyltransferase YncA
VRGWFKGLSNKGPRPIVIREAAALDIERLAEYFGTLSEKARHNRFMGPVNDLTMIADNCLKPGSGEERFVLFAELRKQGRSTIIGEACYGFDRDLGCGEFAISVADDCRRQGLGSALLWALQFRAVSLGFFRLFGEALKTNEEMKGFARKAGFEFTCTLDWRAVRFDKNLAE